MAISDEVLAATLEVIRREQIDRVRRRLGSTTPAHVLSEAQLQDTAHHIREAEIARVCGHPAFSRVGRAIAQAGLPEAADNGVAIHALRDVGKLAAATWALYLHVTPGGLTHARFDAFCEVSGHGSKAWSYALLTYLRFLGYIEPSAETGDLRERHYRPTDRMRQAFRGFVVSHLRAVAPIDADSGAYAARVEADDAAFDAFMAELGVGSLVVGLLHRFNPGPTLDIFSRRRSGMVILWGLLLSAPPSDGWPPREAFPLSLAAMARKAGVSRMHLTRALRDGEQAGLLALDGAGSVQVTDLLRTEVNTFAALYVICLGATVRAARRRVDPQAAA